MKILEIEISAWWLDADQVYSSKPIDQLIINKHRIMLIVI